MTTRRLTAVLLLFLTGAAAADAGPRKKVTRFFDLGAIVREYEESAFIGLGPLGSKFEERWSGEDNGSAFLVGEEVASLVRSSGLFGNGHRVWCDAEQIGVTADAEDLPAVARLITDRWSISASGASAVSDPAAS